MGTRPGTDPAVGNTDVLTVDADPGGASTWLADEIAAPVAQSSTVSSRTLSAGTVHITLPKFFSGPGAVVIGGTAGTFVLRQKDAECSLDGTLDIEEVAYTADLQVATFSAAYSGSCTGAASVYGEIRINSTQAFAAVTVDKPHVDLGKVMLGTQVPSAHATLRNVGTKDLVLSVQPLSGGFGWQLGSNRCGIVAPGQTCTISMDLTPSNATEYAAVVDVLDGTSRGERHIRFSASVYTAPQVHDVKADATYFGVDLSWRPGSWGNAEPVGYVVQRSIDGIATRFTLPPDQTHWTEPYPAGLQNATYRVSAVNEFLEGSASTAVSPIRGREQLTALIGDAPGEPASLGSTALPLGRQIVPSEKPLISTHSDLASSPNGVDLAYVRADGDQNRLWIRRGTDGTATDTALVTAPGLAHPAWSPDGTRIAYSTNGPDSTRCVDVVTIAGGSVVRVGCGIDTPIWHTDSNTLIVQDKNLEGAPLIRIEASENGARIGTLAGSHGVTRPVVSPYGDFIAFIPESNRQQVGFLPIDGGTQTLTDIPSPSGVVSAVSWNTSGNRVAVVIEGEGGEQIMVLDARAALGDGNSVEWNYAYLPTSQHFSALIWQGRSVVIAPTPSSFGTSVSIPFDTSSLPSGGIVQCYLDGEYYGQCTSPFTASGLSSGTHSLRVEAVWPAFPSEDSYGTIATRTFTVG
ncbi:Ig-like domain-containing protein [Kribbella swartbergensis]